MDSVGVFREGEIDGKPFHILTFLSQPSSSSSSDLGGDHLSLESPQPRFLCPSSRVSGSDDTDYIVPYYASPYFPNNNDDNVVAADADVDAAADDATDDADDVDADDDDSDADDDTDDDETDDDEEEEEEDEDDEEICKLPVLPIFWCNNKEPNEDEFECGACKLPEIGTSYYICLGCERMFHKECVETPLEIQNPSYPFLSFRLHHLFFEMYSCIICKLDICGMNYHCPTNEFTMHSFCATKPIPIVIDHPKRHSHILTFFPKQASLLCDVCGLVEETSLPTYVCLRCIFVVHQDCIYLPFVIKISRHPHRISFTSSLPSGKWSCGVCRQKVDNRFGAYSCNKCSDYYVHSKCAVRRDVWDGKELEGVPEEPEIVVEPFEKISEGIIRHFTHDHHLQFEVSKVYNEYTICQACVLPVYEGNYYSCLDGCDFVLHETCASAPRKIHHPLYAHPLTLKAKYSEPFGRKDHFQCNACVRVSCGFVYQVGNYNIDVRCASVSEPFAYQGHEHPLFLSLDPTEEKEATCRICRSFSEYVRKLSCIECDYVICFKCATLPYEVKYEHDEHFLTFREGKEGSDLFDWCEGCERKIKYSSKDGFYECDKCCTTLHVHCLLGEDPYLRRPGYAITFNKNEFQILLNNTQSRPECQKGYYDTHLCRGKVVYKCNDKTYCSYACLMSYPG